MRRVMPTRGAREKAKTVAAEPTEEGDVDDPVQEPMPAAPLAPVIAEKVKVVQTKVVGHFHKKKVRQLESLQILALYYLFLTIGVYRITGQLGK